MHVDSTAVRLCRSAGTATPNMSKKNGFKDYESRYGTGQLTRRLTEVAHCMLRGETSDKGIAAELGISDSTVATLKKHLFAIMGVHTAVELIVKERDGLLSIPAGWRKQESESVPVAGFEAAA